MYILLIECMTEDVNNLFQLHKRVWRWISRVHRAVRDSGTASGGTISSPNGFNVDVVWKSEWLDCCKYVVTFSPKPHRATLKSKLCSSLIFPKLSWEKHEWTVSSSPLCELILLWVCLKEGFRSRGEIYTSFPLKHSNIQNISMNTWFDH